MGTFWQARPLPGRNDQLVATFAPHHGFPHGAIGLIDHRAGPDYQTMLRAIEVGKRLADEMPEADMPGFRGARPEP